MQHTKLIQDENLSITIAHQLLPLEQHRIDLYFSLPNEMGISSQTLDEDSYFHSGIKTSSSYYSDQLHLPLVRSRFISAQKGLKDEYRVNLNLFCYQIKVALDHDLKQVAKEKDHPSFFAAIEELAQQTKSLLIKLRRNKPSDQKLISYYENADNYLSWHFEQSLLNAIRKGGKTSEDTQIRERLIQYCRDESQYRKDNNYNSQTTLNDPNRITNKMRLLQRLIEYGVVFKKDLRNLNKNLKRFVRGSVTAVIMALVMTLVLNARSSFTEVTLFLVAILGVIYGLRETFKDEITQAIWRKIQHGLPKWQHVFSNSATQEIIARQTIWLEFIKNDALPEAVQKQFNRRRQQNKMAAQLLHYRSQTRVNAKQFLPGYNEIQQQITFSLAPFVRYLKKGEGKLFTLDNHKISQHTVEQRYQINAVLVQTQNKKQLLQRFKITLNRSGIINVEAMTPFSEPV